MKFKDCLGLFEKCDSMDEYIKRIDKLTVENKLGILKVYKKEKKKNCKLVDSELMNKFYEYFDDKPKRMKLYITSHKIPLIQSQRYLVMDHLIEEGSIKIGGKHFRENINEAIKRNINSDDDDKKLKKAIETIVLKSIFRNIDSKLKLTDTGINIYYMYKNKNILDEIKDIKAELILREDQIKEKIIGISGIVIALFSIIGFNIYSIKNSMSAVNVYILNLSVLFSISVMFFYIEIISSNKGREKLMIYSVVFTGLILFASIYLLIEKGLLIIA